jgi:hypothetical protein
VIKNILPFLFAALILGDSALLVAIALSVLP